MPLDSRGEVVFPITSNRAPGYSDGAYDGTLLGAGAQKIVPMKHADGTPGIASSVRIVNASGMAAALLVTVAQSRVVTEVNPPGRAVYLDVGETLTLNNRVVSVVETNLGAGAQAGRGVRYTITFEPTK